MTQNLLNSLNSQYDFTNQSQNFRNNSEFSLLFSNILEYLYISDRIIPIIWTISLIIQLYDYSLLESNEESTFNNFSLLYGLNLAISLFYTFDFLIKIYWRSHLISLPHYTRFFLYIDLISGILGPISIMISIFYFSLISVAISHMILFSKFFTLSGIRNLLMRFYKIGPALLPFVFHIFLFIYILTSLGINIIGENTNRYWKNYSNSFLNIFALLTFDNWGSVVFASVNNSGWFSGLFLTFLAFFVNYCILSFFNSCVVDFLYIYSKNPKLMQEIIEFNNREEKINNTLLFKIVVGKYYTFIMVGLFGFFIWKELGSSQWDDELYICIMFFLILFSNIHFFFYLVFISEYWNNFDNNFQTKEILAIIIHILAGPLAFILFFHKIYNIQTLNIINILLILKTFTINQSKYLLFDNLKAILKFFHFNFFFFVAAYFLAFFACGIFLENFPDDFSSTNKSFIKILQTIVLDGWSPFLRKIDDEFIIATIFDFSIILVFQFIFLNILIASYCAYMTKVYISRCDILYTYNSSLMKTKTNENFDHKKIKIYEIIENIEIIEFTESENIKLKNLKQNLDDCIEIKDCESNFIMTLKKKIREEYIKYLNYDANIIKKKEENNNFEIFFKGKKKILNNIYFLRINNNLT